MEKLLLLIDSENKAALTNIFCAYFFSVFIFGRYEFFCILRMYPFLQVFEKKILGVFNFVKLTKITKFAKKYTRGI